MQSQAARWLRGARATLPALLLLVTYAAGEEPAPSAHPHVTIKSGRILSGQVVGTERADAGPLLVLETEFGQIRVPKPQVATVTGGSTPVAGTSFDIRAIHVTRIVGLVEAKAPGAMAWRKVAWADEYGKAIRNEPNALVRPGDQVRTGEGALLEVMLHSKVWMRLLASTEATFPPAPNASEASIKVGVGRAQWEVQGLPRGRTFRVGVPSAILGVRGTRFAVEASSDAERVLVFEGTVDRATTSVTAGWMLDVRDAGALPARVAPSQTRAFDSPPVKMPPQDAVLVPGGTYRLKGRQPPPGVILAAHLDDWTRASDIEVILPDFLLDRRPASSIELRAFERSRAADTTVPPAVGVETVTLDAAQADGLVAWQGKDLPTEAQYEVAVRGAAGKWPTPRTDVEYSWGGDLRYQDPAYAHPSDISPWGVPGLLKHERLWMRGPYTSGPFFRAGAAERAAFDSWKAANGALRLQRGRYPGLYPSVYPGTARSPKYADPQIRVPADPVGIGFVRGVVELGAR